MKFKTFPLLSIVFFILGTSSLDAQTTPLPYSCGFTNTSQNAAWQKFRKGFIDQNDWEFYPSFTGVIHHSYPQGGSPTDTLKDWVSSPAFDLSAGGVIDTFRLRLDCPFGAAPGTKLEVYLLKGSPNPSQATSATLLADLTKMFFADPTLYKDTGNFIIPPTTGNSYIAIKYQIAGVDWFIVDVDKIVLHGNGGTSCNAPANVTITNLAPYSAKLTWPSVNGSSGYEYAVTTSATPPASGTSTTALTYTAPGLNASNTYYGHVRTKCNGGVFSGWKSQSFLTKPAAIGDVNAVIDFYLYPNPVENVMTVKYGGPGEKAVIVVSDLTGRKLKSVKASGEITEIDLSSLPTGSYVVSYQSERRYRVLAIVKQ